MGYEGIMEKEERLGRRGRNGEERLLREREEGRERRWVRGLWRNWYVSGDLCSLGFSRLQQNASLLV